MIEIRRITTDDPLFEEARHLREDVLLRPLGITLEQFDAAAPGLEARAEHHVCVMDHPRGPRVVGCAMLLAGEPDEAAATIAQVAIHRQRQGEGIGRRLLATLESRAFGELGLERLTCTAHPGAVGFYQAMGWVLDGEPFLDFGVEHQRMTLSSIPTCPEEMP